MIGELFRSLLITSLAGSVLAVIIILFRPITKKLFGYSWHYYIWLCVLFVMIMPVRFNIDIAAIPSIASQTVQTEQATDSVQSETDKNIIKSHQNTQFLQKADAAWNSIIHNRINILAYLWLIGTAVLILLNIARYVRLNIRMCKNSKIICCPEISKYTDRKINVRVWKNIASPFMTGVLNPTLVLPKAELSDEQLNNILRHEMTHFRRYDILYKWLAEFIKCVHWFNPIVWYVSKQISAECEISCDMAVTKNMSGSEKMSYINTILSLISTKKPEQLQLTTQMAGSKKILKRRFIMIKNKKTTSRFMSLLSAVIAFAMLSTTVFASGILSSITPDSYTSEKADQYNNTASDVKIYYGNSAIYTEKDMNDAIEIIKEKINSWEGCELHSLSYSSDDCNNADNIAWMNDFDSNEIFTQCIVFESSFRSPKEGGGAWEANEEYTWSWWLARSEGGKWQLMTWGY